MRAQQLVLIGGITLCASLATGTSVADVLSVTPNTNATSLANSLIGTGVSLVGTPIFTGLANQQAGTFTGGVDAIGIGSGVVLSTGRVSDIPGLNVSTPETRGAGGSGTNSLSSSLGTSGDTDVAVVAGVSTYDAAVLEFQFQFGDGTVGGDLFFNYVFASEEYIDYIGSEFNDAFVFLLDGSTNLATIGTDPISINSVNDVENSAFYINNVDNTNGLPVAGKENLFDGQTTVLQASALGLGVGVHSIKLAVADGSDRILDAGVFIQAGSFSTEPTPVVPIPAALPLFGSALLGLGFVGRRKGKRAEA